MISRFFIERPILANVIAILIIILVEWWRCSGLPVAQYPEITPPTVQVTATYPGASARVVADTIALPIEQQVNGVQDMLYMQSTSASDGTYKLVITFKARHRPGPGPGAGPEPASPPPCPPSCRSTCRSREPSPREGLHRHPAGRKPLFPRWALRQPVFKQLCLDQPAGRYLARLPGVGDVTVFGVGQYSMRVWLDPEMLKTFGLDPSDVVSAIQQQNLQVPAGQVGMPPAPAGQNFQFPVNVAGRLDEVEQFENIIVKIVTGQGSRIIRLKDVGRVELGAQTTANSATSTAGPAAGIAIYQLPGANALQVADEVPPRPWPSSARASPRACPMRSPSTRQPVHPGLHP